MNKINIYTGKEPEKELRVLDEEIRRICSYLYPSTFDDLVFEMTPGRLGALTKPDWDATNIGFLFPENDATEIVYIVAQIPHKYRLGTVIYPHVHCQQASNQQAVMKMDYKWFNIGDAIPVGWTTYTMGTYAVTYSSGTIHQVLKGTGIAGTGMGMSSLMVIKLYRDDNVYTGDLLVQQFDIHVEADMPGSREEYSK
jgi:hypothetical protein